MYFKQKELTFDNFQCCWKSEGFQECSTDLTNILQPFEEKKTAKSRYEYKNQL